MPVNKTATVVVFIGVHLLSLAYCSVAESYGNNVTENCIVKTCSFTNGTSDTAEWCDESCRQIHCEQGCRLWESAVVVGCKSACGSTESHSPEQVNHCRLSCESAVALYANESKAQLGPFPTPAPAPGSVTNTSVTLKWTWTLNKNWQDVIIDQLTNVSIQWRQSNPEASSHQWHSAPLKLAVNSTVIKNLQPFTSYNFRLVIWLANDVDPVASAESVNVTTLAYGPPSSAPLNLAAEAVDEERITVVWNPPKVPNGPIVAYSLTIRDATAADGAVDPRFQDFVALNAPRRHTFIHLKPNTTYVVAISARNAAQPNETGPSSSINITTSALETASKLSVLIVIDNKTIERHDSRLLSDDPKRLYSLKNTSITSVDVHVKQNSVFVADSTNSIHQLIGLLPQWEPHKLLDIESKGFSIKKISVDWLFNQLYLLLVNESMWKISRTDLNGLNFSDLINGRAPSPDSIEVDPFNGFLIWSINSQTGGLFCIDLADLSQQNPENATKKLKSGNVASFKVDPINGRVLTMMKVDTHNRTIVSVYFDGTTSLSAERRSLNHAEDPSHLIYAEEAFLWLNEGFTAYEEIDEVGHPHVNRFHTTTASKHTNLALYDAKNQPTPLPVSPVKNLQVLFDWDSAHVKWEPPLSLRRGRGAWTGWTYRLELRNLETGTVHTKDSLNGTEIELKDLKPNTPYSVKVEPQVNLHLEAKPVIAKTLARNQQGPIYWAASDGQIYRSTLTGKKAKSIFDLKAWSDGESVVNMAWMSDVLYVATNGSRLFKIDVKSRKVDLMNGVEAISVAADWLGKKIYYGSAKRQTIGRLDVDGNRNEWLPIVGIAKTLAIHSIKGRLVWSTGHSIEGAFLNGDSLVTYWSPGLFSGSQAIGLTIDLETDQIYWIVKQVDGAAFVHRSSIDLSSTTIEISSIDSSVQGPLHYSAGRLIWLENHNAIISNLDGTNRFTLNTPEGRSMRSFFPCYASQNDTLNVIPGAVREPHLEVKDDALVIRWPTVNVSHGSVSYNVRIHHLNNELTSITNSSSVAIPKEWGIGHYEAINVSIQSFTVWSTARMTSAQLRSPESTPEAPRRPRAFVTLKGNSSPKNATIEVRWSPPTNANGQLTSYRVLIAGKDGAMHKNVTLEPYKTELVLDLMAFTYYLIAVEAATKIGYGPPSDVLNVSTVRESHLPHLLAVTSSDLWLVDLDDTSLSNKTTPGVTSFPHAAVTYLNSAERLFWIENRLLHVFELHSAQSKQLYELNGTATSLSIDWISHHLYWSQKDIGGSSIYRLETKPFASYERNVARRIIHDADLIALVNIDPLTNNLFWLKDNRNGSASLIKYSVSDDMNEQFFDSSPVCSCSRVKLPIDAVTSIDYSSNEMRIFWTSRFMFNHPVWSSNGCDCRIEFIPSDFGVTGGFSSLSVDGSYLSWSDSRSGKVYHLQRPLTNSSKVETINEIGSRKLKTLEEDVYQLKKVQKVFLLSPSTQPMPRSECLRPTAADYTVELINKTSESLTLLMPKPQRQSDCLASSMAPCSYVLFYGPESDQQEVCSRDLKYCLHHMSAENFVTLEQLNPFTNYIVYVVLTSIYEPVKLLTSNSIPSHFMTEPGTPSPPRNVSVLIATPRSVRVQWLPPLHIRGPIIAKYSVHWFEIGTALAERADFSPSIAPVNLRYFLDVQSLKPNTSYSFSVRAHSVDGSLSAESESVTITTFADPAPLVFVGSSESSITLAWASPKQSIIQRHVLQVYHPEHNVWNVEVNSSLTAQDYLYKFTIENLKPSTSYAYRLQFQYMPNGFWFSWPTDERGLNVTTRGTPPERPSPPRVTVISENSVELWWESALRAGRPVPGYVLEMKTRKEGDEAIPLRPEIEITSEWIVIYNGTTNFQVVRNLTRGPKYQFRLLAYNEIGASNYSEPTPLMKINDPVQDQATGNLNLILGLCISTMTVFIFALAGILICGFRKLPFQAKKAQAISSHPSTTSEMTDLATLRELPRRSSFIQQSNAIYDVGDCDIEQELALLPHIRFEDLVITKFLGRGAFGEVFEGSTSNLPGSNQYHTKVAVKTLRKGATDQEKNEFLKEAILMSHFKHDHILRLLGVCLDADPNFILLELMEGGDLLSYLRNNRPHQRNNPSVSVALGLYDLVSMCVDVAKGCCYLEELHFVHRDLAARNCLVSSHDPNYRVVKIGDFGLARDIYRNDYYRKEGEGLLPVRWMAPESLVDGVFTSQTDVWSFGVLLWEILTLGQQPYPARTNLQVLHFVRAGGRLDRPRNCPDSLFTLMMRCWSYDPSIRPTFAQCLAELTALQTKLRHATFTAVHNESYVSNPTLPRDCVVSGALWNSGDNQSEVTITDATESLESGVRAIYSNTKEELFTTVGNQQDNGAYSTESDPDTPTESEGRYLELLSDQSPSVDSAFTYIQNDNESNTTDESCLSRSATP